MRRSIPIFLFVVTPLLASGSVLAFGPGNMAVPGAFPLRPAPTMAAPWGKPSSYSLNVRTWFDDDAYYVDIEYEGMAPRDIEVLPRKGGVLVRSARSRVARQPQPGGGQQWFRMQQVFQNNYSLPMDADLRRLERRDRPGLIRVIVPRLQMPMGRYTRHR